MIVPASSSSASAVSGRVRTPALAACVLAGLLALCFGLAAAPSVAGQDRVELKNGGAFSGKIVFKGPDWVVLKSGAATYTFVREDILRIRHGGVRSSTGGKTNTRPGARRSGRPRRRSNGTSGVKRAAETAIGQNASRVFGRLSEIRFDRHPGYAALHRTKAGTWAVYAIEGATHDTERWVVVSVRSGRILVKATSYRQGRIVKETERGFQLTAFGPQMPVKLLRKSTLSKENIRTRLGTFACLRVSGRDGRESTAFASAAPISGIVDQRIGTLRRRLIQMGYRRRGVDEIAEAEAETEGTEAQPGAPIANPVAEAYEGAARGDFALWRDPATNRRWREVIAARSDSALRIIREVAQAGGFKQDGFRSYTLGSRARDYLERYDARPDGHETLRLGGKAYRCLRWRSKSGNVRFWTSPEVPIGGLVRQTINGRVVRELVSTGRLPDADRR